MPGLHVLTLLDQQPLHFQPRSGGSLGLPPRRLWLVPAGRMPVRVRASRGEDSHAVDQLFFPRNKIEMFPGQSVQQQAFALSVQLGLDFLQLVLAIQQLAAGDDPFASDLLQPFDLGLSDLFVCDQPQVFPLSGNQFLVHQMQFEQRFARRDRFPGGAEDGRDHAGQGSGDFLFRASGAFHHLAGDRDRFRIGLQADRTGDQPDRGPRLTAQLQQLLVVMFVLRMRFAGRGRRAGQRVATAGGQQAGQQPQPAGKPQGARGWVDRAGHALNNHAGGGLADLLSAE